VCNDKAHGNDGTKRERVREREREREGEREKERGEGERETRDGREKESGRATGGFE
jgi:hypothetical protein